MLQNPLLPNNHIRRVKNKYQESKIFYFVYDTFSEILLKWVFLEELSIKSRRNINIIYLSFQ